MEEEDVAVASIPHTIPKEAELERREETWTFCLGLSLQSMQIIKS